MLEVKRITRRAFSEGPGEIKAFRGRPGSRQTSRERSASGWPELARSLWIPKSRRGPATRSQRTAFPNRIVAPRQAFAVSARNLFEPARERVHVSSHPLDEKRHSSPVILLRPARCYARVIAVE